MYWAGGMWGILCALRPEGGDIYWSDGHWRRGYEMKSLWSFRESYRSL